MEFLQNRPVRASVILHLLLLSGLFLGLMVKALKPKENLHVFEMVSVSEEALPAPEPTVGVTEAFDQPDSPVAEAVLNPPGRIVSTEPELISIEDFRRDHPRKTPPRRSVPLPTPKIKAPVIQVSDLIAPQAVIDSSEEQLSQSRMHALSQYSARLQLRLKGFWDSALSQASLNRDRPSNGVGYAAVVFFEVSARGDLGNVKLSPGSGDPDFDQLVLAVFRQVARHPEPTPTGQSHTFQMTFRLR